jgi:hypothetical protein
MSTLPFPSSSSKRLSGVPSRNGDCPDVSPKTVDANLPRVYGRLGIDSRAELGAKLGSSA